MSPVDVTLVPLPGFPGMPRLYHEDDACMDILCPKDFTLGPEDGIIRVGLRFRLGIPRGYKVVLVPRSGLALHFGLTIPEAPAQIDAGYKGEIHALLTTARPVSLNRGDRFLQMYVDRVIPMRLVTQDTLDTKNDRGGGLGHSGR